MNPSGSSDSPVNTNPPANTNQPVVPTIAPITRQDKVKYTSSKKKIASVSSKGVIKAVSPGTAKITVKSGKKKTVKRIPLPRLFCTHAQRQTKRCRPESRSRIRIKCPERVLLTEEKLYRKEIVFEENGCKLI